MRWQGYDELLHVSITMVDEWFGLDLLRLNHMMEVEPVLALVVVARIVEVDKAFLPDQERLLHKCAQRMLVLKIGEYLMVSRIAIDVDGERDS